MGKCNPFQSAEEVEHLIPRQYSGDINIAIFLKVIPFKYMGI